MIRNLIACQLSLAALAFATPAHAADCTEITLPNTVVAPGRYCLGASSSSSVTTGALLTINGDDIEFDCRGMALHNTQTDPNANSYAVYVAGKRNVGVRNCRITGTWTIGIYVNQNNGLANANRNVSVTGNDISGASWIGIQGYGTDIEIAHNRVSDIGGRSSFAMGIRVGGSGLVGEKRFHVVRDNVVSDVISPVNYGYGIYSNNSDDGVFADNTIVGQLGDATWFNYGVRLAAGARNRITGNHIVGGQDGYATGIRANATDKCYHNDIRADYPTLTCDASLGNY